MIEYRIGDIFDIKENQHVIVAHVVNNVGAFGAGFAKAMAEKWPSAKTHYHANFSWYNLGDVLMSPVWIPETGRPATVAHLFAQDGLPSRDNPKPLKMLPLNASLIELRDTMLECPEGYEVWMPRIGTGYGRGDWVAISALIDEVLCRHGIKVAVYDLPVVH